MSTVEPFEENAQVRPARGALVLDLDGYEGPIDVLLTLAREQKVDLTRISILELADQYLAFIAEARRLRLEIAADYLVMAAWLAYLKSRLLLPDAEDDEDMPSAPEMAEALAFQLRRIEAMRNAGARLMALPRLGVDVFTRGAPEGIEVVRKPVYECTLFELLKAYGDNRSRGGDSALHIEASELFDTGQMLAHLRGVIGELTDWRTLMSFLPDTGGDPFLQKSAVAASFAAGLELARAGDVELRQNSIFGPIFIRRVPRQADSAASSGE